MNATPTTLTAGTYTMTIPGAGPAADTVNQLRELGIPFSVLEVKPKTWRKPTQTTFELTIPAGWELTMEFTATRTTV